MSASHWSASAHAVVASRLVSVEPRPAAGEAPRDLMSAPCPGFSATLREGREDRGFDGALGVVMDEGQPREAVRLGQVATGDVLMASPFPRPIPGVPVPSGSESGSAEQAAIRTAAISTSK